MKLTDSHGKRSTTSAFPPPKINCVIMRGVNDAEIIDFAALTRELVKALQRIVSGKPERHGITRNCYCHNNFTMAKVVG